MPVAIRRADLSDVAAMVAMERAAPGAAHWTAEQYEKLVGSGVVLLAELGGDERSAGRESKQRGTVCGFMCAAVVAGEWELENVVVASEFLRRGIADELMLGLIEQARSEGGSAILLEVRESNRAARGLYAKHSFCEEGRRRLYYDDPAEDAILYRLSLAG